MPFTDLECRRLFDAVDFGFTIVEVLFDERGHPSDYRFIEVNEAFVEQTGLAGAVGRLMRELAPAHEQRWFDLYGKVALTGEPVRFEQEAAALGRWYSVFAARVGAPEDRRVAIMFSDITGQKRALDDVRDSEARYRALAEELRESEARHEAARLQAERANRSKDEFLAMIAHELRNPLAPMVTALQMMRMRGFEGRELDVLDRQIGHVNRMVEDLLDIGRITRGQTELRAQRVELSAIVIRAMETAGPIVEQRRQHVTLNVPRSGLCLDADLDRMSQVVSNLVTNAAKYSRPGSRITISGGRDGAIVRLAVKDEGFGIAPEMLESIFEPFVQQSQALDQSREGLGLGLAIVRTLVAAHGGTVRAFSEGRDRGSELIVELPALVDGAGTVESCERDA